jgi:hypothetical protein
MNANEIAHYIRFTPWTNDELVKFIDAVKFARAQLTRQNIGEFDVGDRVCFNSAKLGFVTGTVEKVAIKYVTVRGTQFGLYRVPANMLKASKEVAAVA